MHARILVVDDDRLQREEYKTILAARGYSVYMAKNGEEALEGINVFHPDLVVSDILHPDMEFLDGGLNTRPRIAL